MSIIEKIDRLDRMVMKIILALYENEGRMYHSKLKETTGMSVNTLNLKIKDLEHLKYVVEERKDGKRFILLTELGRNVSVKTVEYLSTFDK